MAAPIIMPRQGQSVESCIISKWNKKKGDRVEPGDILFSYETDKASFEEEAKVEGILLDTFFDEGDDVPVLVNVCVIGNEGESTVEFNPNLASDGGAAGGQAREGNEASVKDDVEAAELMAKSKHENRQHDTMQTQNECVEPQIAAAVVNQLKAGEDIKISPRARNLAEKIGIDYRYALPTGPYGRIVEKDITTLKESGAVFTAAARVEQLKGSAVEAIIGTGLGGRITTGDLEGSKTVGASTLADTAYNGASGAGGATGQPSTETLYEEVRLPNIRKVIAKTMYQSLSTMAQLTLNSTFDATDILEFRKKHKANKERLGLENITINDIIIYAVSRTLANHKNLNAHFLDDRIKLFKNVNMGVAVDTDRGLMVPTLFNANLKSLNAISAEVKELVKKCQAGTINPDMLTGGSFTITNLGTLDIESFTPVINPPQTGILGVNNIVQRAREVGEDIEFYPAMGLSLTFDHRAIDGAPAARFLKELKTNLESFSTMLAK
ncbi:MAG: 2-oxo acid dehydrogenase subunit E2 [Clostridiaceae bacterium]|jgi:pyruvate dehydrogenase E2 component (dihydrolipoamide acetyltransferase)|nr:2-oxo acid dehydrogenase subunit E2 [Clostridiaceae bacterium]